MSNSNGALEVSAMVWLDEAESEWMYSVFVIHDDDDEELHAWGVSASKAEAADSVSREISNFFRGV